MGRPRSAPSTTNGTTLDIGERARLNARQGVRYHLQRDARVHRSADHAAGAHGRRDHGRDHVPRQHHDEGLPEEPGGDRRRRSPAAGSTPATWRCSTPTATSRSRTAARTSSSRAARTSRRSRSRTCCTAIPTCWPRPWSPSRTRRWGETPCAFVELKAGAHDHARGHRRALQEAPGRLQGAAGGGVRRVAQDLDRQDPEVRAAQAGRLGRRDRRLTPVAACNSAPRGAMAAYWGMRIISPQAAHVLADPGAFAWRVLKGFRANQGLLLAGAVAYYALLSIVPLLILMVIALSHVDRPGRAAAARSGRYLEWLMPGPVAGGGRRAGELPRPPRRHRLGAAGDDAVLQLAGVHRAGERDVGDLPAPRRDAAAALHRLGAAAVLLHPVPGRRAAGGHARVGQPAGDRRRRASTCSAASWSLSGVSGVLLYLLGVAGEIFVLTSIYLVMPVGRLSLAPRADRRRDGGAAVGDHAPRAGLVLRHAVAGQRRLRLAHHGDRRAAEPGDRARRCCCSARR